ncbi:MAG: hypothetical protein R3B90_21175 [Planctomycetaceae bacterium]
MGTTYDEQQARVIELEARNRMLESQGAGLTAQVQLPPKPDPKPPVHKSGNDYGHCHRLTVSVVAEVFSKVVFW